MKPLIVVNFKTYVQSTGTNGLHLSKIHDKVDGNIIICVQPTDIYRISKEVKVPVFSEHCDGHLVQGKNTGFMLPEAIKEAGAKGTLLNHAEHRMHIEDIEKSIQRCNALGLKVIVCTDNLKEVEDFKKLKPYAIAFEDPILIGTGQSITKSKQDTVKKFADLLKGTDILPLCGAGISTKEDIEEAVKLGTKGVLLASAITTAEDPESVLKSLL